MRKSRASLMCPIKTVFSDWIKAAPSVSSLCIITTFYAHHRVRRILCPTMSMSLFTGNLRRSVGAGVASMVTGALLMWTLPSNLGVFTMAQTSVAILAIGCLMVFTVAHHRRSGQVFTQDQEEMILIGAFGLFWFAFLVAWRAVRQRWSFEGELGMGGGGGVPDAPRRQPGFTGNTRGRGGYRARPWPCSPYDADCVVEEWSYY